MTFEAVTARRTLAVAITCAALAIALAGCTTPGPPTSAFEILGSNQSARDHLPTPAAEIDIDPSSTRLLGEAASSSFWIGLGKDAGGVCLIDAGGEGQEPTAACGGAVTSSGGYIVELTRPDGVRLRLVPDGLPESDARGWTTVNRNLLMRAPAS